jgi:hypothetical protein
MKIGTFAIVFSALCCVQAGLSFSSSHSLSSTMAPVFHVCSNPFTADGEVAYLLISVPGQPEHNRGG